MTMEGNPLELLSPLWEVVGSIAILYIDSVLILTILLR